MPYIINNKNHSNIRIPFSKKIVNSFHGTSFDKKRNIHKAKKQSDLLNVTDPSILKNLYKIAHSEKKIAKKVGDYQIADVQLHKNKEFHNSIRIISECQQSSESCNSNECTDMEKRLNQTDVMNCSELNESNNKGALKLSVIESISNIKFENQNECKQIECKNSHMNRHNFDKMRDDIKPMFFFNAKMKKDSDEHEVETPCFMDKEKNKIDKVFKATFKQSNSKKHVKESNASSNPSSYVLRINTHYKNRLGKC
jgi:hypothetical protein